jgi:hypothetical protein
MRDLQGWALASLASSLRHGRLCLVAGAGASGDFGLPSWEELLAELREKISPPEPETKRTPPRISALDLQYEIWNLAGEANAWLPELLYGSLDERWDHWHHEAEAQGKATFLLAVLSILIAFESPGRVFHAITFNADCLLEEMIARLGHQAVAIVGNRAQRVVWPATVAPRVTSPTLSDPRGPIEVRIFHPHGLALPRDLGKALGLDGDTLDLVFGNDDYNTLFNAAGDRRNLWQLAALSRLQCLFYGFSFTDTNVNRLLGWQKNILSAIEIPEQVDLNRQPSVGSHVALITEYADPEESGRHQIHLAEAGIYRLGHYHFNQHRGFVAELLEQARREREIYWPGSPS